MKLYYTGDGPACTIYLAVGNLTATTTLYKAGQEYPDALVERILADYPHLVSKTEPMKIKLAQPTLKKGGAT